MDSVIEALDAEQRGLAALVDVLDRDGLSRPSACSGWTITDVLLHLAQTNELAVASVAQRFADAVGSAPPVGEVSSVDEWADAVVDAERGTDPVVVRDRWAASAATQVQVFAACDPDARVQWVAGDMAARTLATTRLSETWIHAGDVAEGLGTTVESTDRLWHIARLVQRTVPYSYLRAGREPHGSVGFRLWSPSGEPWTFGPADAATVVSGPAAELCAVAGQRLDATVSSLRADGPDAADVLELVRTFA